MKMQRVFLEMGAGERPRDRNPGSKSPECRGGMHSGLSRLRCHIHRRVKRRAARQQIR